MRLPKPTYREAFPRIDIFGLLSAWKAGRHLCEFWDECGRKLGDALLLAKSDLSVHLGYSLHGPYFNGDEGYVRLPLGTARNRYGGRSLFQCDGCARRRSVLVFDGWWACGRCHGFRYRKQLLTPEVIRYEQMIALREKIGRGRAKRQRQSTFGRLREDLELLEEEFADQWPHVANEEHSRLVTARWITRDEADEIFAPGAPRPTPSQTQWGRS